MSRIILCLWIGVACATVAFAGTVGPSGPLYLTGNGTNSMYVVQGTSIINSWATANSAEQPIAVYGDVRTTGASSAVPTGSQYSLGGVFTGVTYTYLLSSTRAFDGTTDGAHNYLMGFDDGFVYQTNRDYSNPVALFPTAGLNNVGITYDGTNNSLWISGWSNDIIADYTMTGGLIFSFSTGHGANAALALDPADQTLWITNNSVTLEQWTKGGTFLGTGITLPGSLGGEFDLAPEPGTLLMAAGALGFLLLKGRRFRTGQ